MHSKMAQCGPEAHLPQFQRSRLVSDLIIRNEWRQVLGVLAMILVGFRGEAPWEVA